MAAITNRIGTIMAAYIMPLFTAGPDVVEVEAVIGSVVGSVGSWVVVVPQVPGSGGPFELSG